MLAPHQDGNRRRSTGMQGGERLLDRSLDAFVARPEHRRVAVSYQPVGEDHPARAHRRVGLELVSEVPISDPAAMICGSLSRSWALRKIRLACSAASSISRSAAATSDR